MENKSVEAPHLSAQTQLWTRCPSKIRLVNNSDLLRRNYGYNRSSNLQNIQDGRIHEVQNKYMVDGFSILINMQLATQVPKLCQNSAL